MAPPTDPRPFAARVADDALEALSSLSDATALATDAILAPRKFRQCPLDGFLIIDATGTVLAASDCYLVDGSKLSDLTWDNFDTMSDSEVVDVAKCFGRKLSEVVTTSAKLPGES